VEVAHQSHLIQEPNSQLYLRDSKQVNKPLSIKLVNTLKLNKIQKFLLLMPTQLTYQYMLARLN